LKNAKWLLKEYLIECEDPDEQGQLYSIPIGKIAVAMSDEQMEFQLLDRLSFQRFVGLCGSSQIPDRTTIWTFKERLIQAGASESIFEAVNKQLSKHGYIARGGQMIDASIVQAPKQSLTSGVSR